MHEKNNPQSWNCLYVHLEPHVGMSPNSIDSLNHFMDTVAVATSSSLGFDVVLGSKQIHPDK